MNNEKYFYDFGYKYFGQLLYDFNVWLKKELDKKNIKKVFFLARDGFIMKKTFDILFSNSEIISEYFYASRRSIIVPSLEKCNTVEDIFNSVTLPGSITIKSFLKRIGIEEFDVKKYLDIYSLDIDTVYSLESFRTNNKLIMFFNDILDLIHQNSRLEQINLLKYAEEKAFNGRVAIVDIGWNGTMQKALSSIFDVEIYGFYFGLFPQKNLNAEYYKGFLFSKDYGIDVYSNFHNFIDIFEYLFLAQHGSVKKFTLNGVEFYDYEYSNENEEKYVKAIQSGALNRVRFISSNEKISKSNSIKNFEKIFLKPKLKDAVMFGNLRFLDDDIKYVAKPKKLLYYIVHFSVFKKDFISSGWRIGFLKRLIKIPFPYYFVNNCIRKIYLKEGKK